MTIGTFNTLRGTAGFRPFADVIGWQEVNTNDDRDAMVAALPGYDHWPVKPLDAVEPARSIPISWRRDLFELVGVEWTPTTPPRAGVTPQRGITSVILTSADGGFRVAVVNTHFISKRRLTPWRRRMWNEHLAALAAVVRRHTADGSEVVVVVGDMNRHQWLDLPGLTHAEPTVPLERVPYDQIHGPAGLTAVRGPAWGSDHHSWTAQLTEEIPMATPMTPEQLLGQLKRWCVPYREIDGWRTLGRDAATGLKFGPVYGGVIHHTGSDGLDSNNRQLIINGRSDLPGPLAQFGGNDNGVIDLISIHRCNHAGGGDPDVLAAVKAESYGDYPPHTDKHQGEAGAVDGNDPFYGEECYYSGAINMTPELYRSSVLLWAAVCDFHGWSAKSIIGHKEWSDWKPDPGRIDMKVFRRDIQRALDAGAATDTDGPVFITPRITKAIAANIAYDKALDAIHLAAAQDEVLAYRAQLKKQRVALRDMERK